MIFGFKRTLTCVALALALMPARVWAQSVTVTTYEHLNLGDPESALREFLGAYGKGDFLVAYWILSPASQTELQKQYWVLNSSRFFDRKLDANELVTAYPAQEDIEQTDFGFVMADLMRFGLARGIQPLNVAGMPGDISKANVPVIGKRTERTDGQVEFAVGLKSYRAPVVFRLQTSPSGRWRVHQIIIPGGDENTIPFSTPKAESP